MIDILMFIPPQAQLSISFDDYKRFLEIAKQEEQLRIIKLLTDHFQHRDLNGIRLDNFHNNSLDEAIELIKGEK